MFVYCVLVFSADKTGNELKRTASVGTVSAPCVSGSICPREQWAKIRNKYFNRAYCPLLFSTNHGIPSFFTPFWPERHAIYLFVEEACIQSSFSQPISHLRTFIPFYAAIPEICCNFAQ